MALRNLAKICGYINMHNNDVVITDGVNYADVTKLSANCVEFSFKDVVNGDRDEPIIIYRQNGRWFVKDDHLLALNAYANFVDITGVTGTMGG